MERYNAYDPFAWVYNQHWGVHSLRKFTPLLDSFLSSLITPPARILDLCCGTGQLTRWFMDRGYQTTGLDGSETMLQYARENAPESDFILADVRAFTLPPTYHVATAMFDSLNHLLTREDLTAALCNAHHALLPGGALLCDFNPREKMTDGWSGDFSIVEDDHVCIVKTRYEAATQLATWKITIFRQQEAWERTDLTLTQRIHDEDTVRQAFTDAGFADIRIYDAKRVPEGISAIAPGKTYYLAFKSA